VRLKLLHSEGERASAANRLMTYSAAMVRSSEGCREIPAGRDFSAQIRMAGSVIDK
jgi:hypothetical protein